jgi:hypothetical protein
MVWKAMHDVIGHGLVVDSNGGKVNHREKFPTRIPGTVARMTQF